MPRIFLSYARDDLAVARRLYAALSYVPNIEVWFDQEALYVGDQYKPVIEAEIRAADYVVALLSAAYVPERFQHFELVCALAEHHRRLKQDAAGHFLLPLFLSPVEIAIPGFNALHRIEADHDPAAAFAALRSRIKHRFPSRAAAEKRVRCQAHIANFRGLPRDAYFLKVANIASDPFSVTHVWIEVRDEEWFFEYPRSRPVPSAVLPPGTEWETFLFCDMLPGFPGKQYFDAFRVRLSNGEVHKSYKNNNVAAYGKIAGGPLVPDEEPRVVRLPL